MIDYKIIEGIISNQKEFENKVKDAMNKGWKPLGGVSISPEVSPYSFMLVQALTKTYSNNKSKKA